jgi:hypothetical protein
MDYETYYATAQQGGQEFEKGDYAAAQSTFQSLLDTDISDLDKCAMCLNLLLAVEKREAPAEEIQALYDRAIGYERPHRRYRATEQGRLVGEAGTQSQPAPEEMLTYDS